MSISPLWIMLISLAALAAFCVRRIPEGQVYSLRRFGGHTRFVGAGMHFMLPLIERVSHKMSLTGSSIEVPCVLQSGEPFEALIYFQVLDPRRADRVIDSVDALLRQQVTHLLAGDSIPGEPAERRLWLKQSLNNEVRERGLLVTRIDLRHAA
ncbi:SPFH domain-containing protein [Dokdonella sp.]|uniref:SPFH domain-containing protein n=1 Tax=Dokdonella sp. TaxID=2291710 RepID=UPI003C5D6834